MLRLKCVLSRKALLFGAVTLAILGPVLPGFIRALGAQSRKSAPQEFEVVSIHRVDGERTVVRIAPQPAGFVADGATLQMLIQFAYRVQYFQVSGGPGWTNSRDYKFDIRAKSPAAAPEDQI